MNEENNEVAVEVTIEEIVEEAVKGEPEADNVTKKFDLDPQFAENLKYLGDKVKDNFHIICGTHPGHFRYLDDHEAKITARINIEKELSDLTLPLFVNLTDRTCKLIGSGQGPQKSKWGYSGIYVETKTSPAMLGHIKVILENQFGPEIAKTDVYEMLETLADTIAIKNVDDDFSRENYVWSRKTECDSNSQKSDAKKNLKQLRQNKPSWVKRLFGAGKRYRTEVEELQDEIAMHDGNIESYVSQKKEERLDSVKEMDSDSKLVYIHHLANHLGDQIRPLAYFKGNETESGTVQLNNTNPYLLLMKLPVDAKAYMTGVLKMMEDEGELTEEEVTAKKNCFSKPARLEHSLRYAKETGQLHKNEQFMRMYNNLKV